jgi:hypothetical protein
MKPSLPTVLLTLALFFSVQLGLYTFAMDPTFEPLVLFAGNMQALATIGLWYLIHKYIKL